MRAYQAKRLLGLLYCLGFVVSIEGVKAWVSRGFKDGQATRSRKA